MAAKQSKDKQDLQDNAAEVTGTQPNEKPEDSGKDVTDQAVDESKPKTAADGTASDSKSTKKTANVEEVEEKAEAESSADADKAKAAAVPVEEDEKADTAKKAVREEKAEPAPTTETATEASAEKAEKAGSEPSEVDVEEKAPTPESEEAADTGDDSGNRVEAEIEPSMATDADTNETLTRAGFTGEIEGRVYTLEELETIAADDAPERPLDLEELYESTLTTLNEHDIVTGRIVSIGEKDVVIDIGFKSDGIVPRNEFDAEVESGDEVEVYLERLEDRSGQLVLSKQRADDLRRWQRIEDAFENDSIVEGKIVNRIKGGMVVDLFGTEAFLPGSQIDIRPVRDFDAYLEKRMEFKVVKLNPINGNVVVSHKALIEKDLQEQREKILAKMEPGQVLEGLVKNITDFGVFIDLGGVDGLLHITDLSWGRVSHPSELVDLDEKLNVVVLDYDKERQRISLGLKQLQPHPWENIEEKLAENQVVEGKVVSITDYGAFVELEKGIEGLVHISEMSWTQHIRHPSEVVSLGDLVQVKVLRIDQEERKISLGMKQLEPDPWEQLAEKHPPGTVAHGTVRNITNFGIFVELEPGVDGLVHISDLSWTKKIRHPSEVVSKGQELDVMVLDIDVENRRLSLGHKQVETNPWNQFAVAYANDTDTTANVSRFEESGIVVELPLEVEAFVPASHLLRDSHRDAYNVGDELELRVIEFDADNRKIVLSERRRVEAAEAAKKRHVSAEKRRERKRDRQEIESFEQDAGAGGPATLGEISGLADLKARMEADEAREKAADKKKKKKEKKKAESKTAKEEDEAATADEVKEEKEGEKEKEKASEPEKADSSTKKAARKKEAEEKEKDEEKEKASEPEKAARKKEAEEKVEKPDETELEENASDSASGKKSASSKSGATEEDEKAAEAKAGKPSSSAKSTSKKSTSRSAKKKDADQQDDDADDAEGEDDEEKDS